MIKIPDTLQEVFDIIVKHLLAQGRVSMKLDEENKPFCMYRSPDGLKCAAGALIPDDQYCSIFEDKDWRGLMIKGFVESKFKDEIMDLQRIHDSAIFRKDIIEFWTRRLKLFAIGRNLEWKFTENA